MEVLHTLIPNFEQDKERLHRVARTGWIFAHRFTWSGPKYIESHYPSVWRAKYEENQYHVCDPIIFWICKPGRTEFRASRWSAIPKHIDIRAVMVQAERYGLRYGAAFSRTVKGAWARSFLSAARADREFTDPEMDLMGSTFDRWVNILENEKKVPTLSKAELEVIICLRDGLGQAETATRLGISESAVKKRIASAMGKLHAATRPQAVALALAYGLL